jgi:hypothetical protein
MSSMVLVLLGYFIIVSVLLTLLWRITLALDTIGAHLKEMSRDLKSIADKKDK